MPEDKPKRNIDERLDAIVESLELLASMHKELERETNERFAEVARKFDETARQFAMTARLFAETDQFINQLAHVAKDHERRIEEIEK